MSNTDARGDAGLRALADEAVSGFGAKGIVAVVVQHDNTFVLLKQGLNHVEATIACGMGIHLSLKEHDEMAAKAAAERATAEAADELARTEAR